jgi:hypothetical protein
MVRRLSREVDRPGEWRVKIAPSETRGLWDLGVHAPTGWRLTSLSAPLEALPAAVQRALHEQLIAVP